MQYKNLFKWSLVIVVIAVAIFFAGVTFFPNADQLGETFNEKPSLSDIDQNPQNRINDELDGFMRGIISPGWVSAELPVRLKIPIIGVDAAIESLGLVSDGSIAPPKGPAEAAWFNLSPRPGENGNAIISGHYGWKDGIRAVFDDLHKLKSGDKISVEDEKGEETHFIVREIRTYNSDSEAVGVFNSADGKAHLVLITCEGIWDRVVGTYSKRLAVFADKQ